MDCSEWLYTSKRLELITLPAGRALPVVVFGTTPFYHITPPVMDWFEHAGRALEARKAPTDQIALYVVAMSEVLAYCRSRYTAAELDAARTRGPRSLPEPEWCPDLASLERAAKPPVFGNNPNGSSAVPLLKAAKPQTPMR